MTRRFCWSTPWAMSAAISGQSPRRPSTAMNCLSRAEIEKAARAVYELLTARQPKPGETVQQHHARVTQADAQYWQKAASLSETLLGPVADQLGTKRLLIVAEGALQYLPFGALPKPRLEGERGKAKGQEAETRVKGQGSRARQ